MRSLFATLIFLHSVSALSSEPNTPARFFETMANHLATEYPQIGPHPHEESFACYGKDFFFPNTASYTAFPYFYSYYRDDFKSGFFSPYCDPENDSLTIRRKYEISTANEFEIVPGIFAKNGLKIIKMKDFAENLNLYVLYTPEKAQQLIHNIILASCANWELCKLPLLAHMFDAGSVFGVQALAIDAETGGLYTDLYR